MPGHEISIIQELVYELRVGDVMCKDVIDVAPDTPMSELRRILREKRISGTPVTDDGRLIGIVSIDDFIRWLSDGGADCPVSERMTTKLITTYDDDPLILAINRLEQQGFGRLPVVTREARKLAGLITKGDVISGLLAKLDIHYRQAEIRDSRSSHIFEDIVADESALIFEYAVCGEDLSVAGRSATGLKTTLNHLGISPPIVRRAAIATYEAEMNAIFYAGGGSICARVEPERIELIVTDTGPGIPDIEQAMQPGFSTAPAAVRELGFGAGMGLHNIKNSADDMKLMSTVGEGTRLEIRINMNREV